MAGKHDKVKDADRTSILSSNLNRCYLCGSTSQICLHEVFYGTANRPKSKEDSMIIPLCYPHHQGPTGVHNNKELDNKLKQQAEKIWIAVRGLSLEEGIKAFIDRYGKNYIDED